MPSLTAALTQILLWVRFTCFIKGIYHDLSIKFTAAQSGHSDKLDAAISSELRFEIDSAMRNGWTGSCEGIYEELCDAAEKEGQVREGELTTRELVQSAVDLSLRNRIQDAASQKGVALEV